MTKYPFSNHPGPGHVFWEDMDSVFLFFPSEMRHETHCRSVWESCASQTGCGNRWSHSVSKCDALMSSVRRGGPGSGTVCTGQPEKEEETLHVVQPFRTSNSNQHFILFTHVDTCRSFILTATSCSITGTEYALFIYLMDSSQAPVHAVFTRLSQGRETGEGKPLSLENRQATFQVCGWTQRKSP